MTSRHINLGAALVAAGLFACASTASAANIVPTTYDYTVSPADVGATGAIFTWDTSDAHGATGLGDATSGAGGQWGSSSFVSNIDGSDTGTGDTAGRYNSLNFDPNALLHTTGLTISDLTGFSYFTKNTGSLDWALRIYTTGTGITTPQWYHYRFDAKNPGNSSGNWQNNDTNTSGWFNNYSLKATDGSGASTPHSIAMSLSDLAADPTFGAEQIEFMTLFVGSSSNSTALAYNLDGLVISTANATANVNLVPEPAALSLLAIGGLSLIRKRRR